MAQFQRFPTVMCSRDHWCCIILALSNILRKCCKISTITIPNIATYILHYLCIVLPTGLRQKHKAPGQVLIIGTVQQCTEVDTLLWIVGFSSMSKNCAHVCNQAVMYMSEADVQCCIIRYLDYMYSEYIQYTCMVLKKISSVP